MKPARLVAHRGSPHRFPENTIRGIEAAVYCGATFVEFDIQFTRDFVPVLYHDPDFQRISGTNGSLFEKDFEEVRNLPASFPARFGNKFAAGRIDSLEMLWQKLPDWPAIQVFPEIKPESVNHFGFERVVQALLELIKLYGVNRQIAAIISKHAETIANAKQFGGFHVGWVAPEFSQADLRIARQIGVDFLFVNQFRIQPWLDHVPRADWKWVIYSINDAAEAIKWLSRGVDMVETDVIDVLIEEANK